MNSYVESITLKMSPVMKRLWLHDIGVFEVIPNSGRGSCLFQAISQALTFSTKFHYKIRRATVDHMTSKKWEKRLRKLPDFWKHKIIRLWLRREREHFIQEAKLKQNAKDNKKKYSGSNNKVGPLLEGSIITESLETVKGCWCCLRFQRFIESRRHKTYFKIKTLLERNNMNTYLYLECFKDIFRQFMSRRDEPGTKFELEAAANLFRFHFDYLQMLRPEGTKSVTKSENDHYPIKVTITPAADSLNQNVGDGSPSFSPANLKSFEDMKDEDEFQEGAQNQPITLEGSMYQFFSCRNNCKLPRGMCPEPFDHYFFLHSPKASIEKYGVTWDRYGLSSSSGLTTHECGHWELLLPISIKKHPVPLNRKIFGLSYEITDAARNFTQTRRGLKREIIDNVGKAIESYVQENPSIIPREDPKWPPDETDDYIGCAASLTPRDSCHQRKSVSGIASSFKKMFQPSHEDDDDDDENEYYWWHSTTTSISHREDMLRNNDDDHLNDAKKTKNNSKDRRRRPRLHYHFYTDSLTGRTLVVHGKSTFLNRVGYWRYKHFGSLRGAMLLLRTKMGRRRGKKKKKLNDSLSDQDDLTSSD